MSAEIHFIKALIKINEKDFDAAIELLTLSVELDSANVEFYAERAVCYLHKNQHELSMFDMNRAIDLEPHYGYRYSCRAYLKGKMGDARGAVEDYEIAVDLDPEDHIALNNLGMAQENLGYWEKAQKNFKKSNELIGYDPENRVVQGDVAVSKDSVPVPQSTQIPVENHTKQTKSQVARDVFTKKSAFRDFVRFIRNGFRIKPNDKS